MKLRLALATGMLLSATAIHAFAEEIGRVQLDGSEIILNDDNTWEYSGEPAVPPGNCTVISSKVLPVSVCLDPDSWSRATLSDAQEFGFGHKSESIYVMIITERDVIELPALKKAIIANAQSAAGLNEVVTEVDSSASLDGHLFGHIIYSTTVDDIDVTYDNYYTNFEGEGSVQILAFAGTDRFDEVSPIIAEVIASVEVDN